jgi:hypothetical protein
MHFLHPKFSAPELETLQKELYRQDFERLGPSIIRVINVWFEGYLNLRNSSLPLLRARAARKWEDIRTTLPAIVPVMLMGPTRETRAEARKLYDEIREEMGTVPLIERLKCLATPILAGWTWLAKKLGIFQQPGLLRIEHRIPDSVSRKLPIMRLQGGFHARPVAVLCEDLTRNFKELAVRAFPTWLIQDKKYPTRAATQQPEAEGTGKPIGCPSSSDSVRAKWVGIVDDKEIED